MTRALARVSADVPAVLERAARDLPAGAARATIDGAQVTSTNTVVVRLAIDGRPPSLVLKFPLSEAAGLSLEREHATLASLHADRRLDRWSELAPRCLHESWDGGRHVAIHTALPGAPVVRALRDDAMCARVLVAAAEALGALHDHSAHEVTVDDAMIARWVDGPVRAIRSGSRALAGDGGEGLRRLADELAHALHGQVVMVGWIHGDAWAGNLLAEPGDPRLTGIVDWDAAEPDGLALHDVLHGLLSARRVRSGRQLGRIVVDQLARPEWSHAEQTALSRYGDAWGGGLSPRQTLLMYWLRQMALHAGQQTVRSTARHRLWERRNVRRVMVAGRT